MELLNMDETLDEPTRLRLSGKALALQHLDTVEVGAHFTLTALAVAVAVSQERGVTGETEKVVEVELHQIDMQPEQEERTEPATPEQQQADRLRKLYDRSRY